MALAPSSLAQATNLGGVLPQLGAQLAPVPESWGDERAPRGAAVALIFIPPAEGDRFCRLVLTLRSTRVGSHKGQVALPGGRRDASDRDPAETAQREAFEEVGLAPESLQVHGVLALTQSLDGSPVYPVVMSCPARDSDFAINSAEVAELFLTPWPEFARERHTQFSYLLFGMERQSHLFSTLQGYHVWGLTAKILWQAQLSAML